MKFAFSTSWAEGDIERVIAVLPFVQSLEIGSKGDKNFFQELQTLIAERSISVTSVHAVAGPGKKEPDSYYAPDFASLDEKKRTGEIELIMESVEWALALGSRHIVLHAGRIDGSSFKELNTRCLANTIRGDETAESADLFEEYRGLRKKNEKEYLEQAARSLDELCSRFPTAHFCIETRLRHYEIPTLDEMSVLLDLPHRNLFYWHDVGHTYIQERMGFASMQSWQVHFKDRCAGAHIHDVDETLTDHYPPGEGMLDIPWILRLFDDDTLLTLEINSRNDTQSVLRGINRMRDTGIMV